MNQIIKGKSIDFNTLVNNNNLSIQFKSKLVNILNDSFTEEESRWYIANYYIYLHYHPTNDYPINLDNVFDLIGFANKANAKRTLKNNFVKDHDYKITLSSGLKNGRPDELIMLNVNTFKNMFMMVKTEKAKKIRLYYVKLENIYNKLVDEDRKDYEKKLLNDKQVYQTKLVELTKEKELERQNILLSQFHKAGSLVYIIKVKTFENGEYIIKIGESRDGITGRWNEFKPRYGLENMRLINCFLVNNSKAFESFLHSKFQQHKVTDWKDHEREKELFLIGKDLGLQKVFDTIDTNIKDYKDNSYLVSQLELQVEKQESEIQKLKANSCNCKNNDFEILMNKLNQMEAKIDSLAIQPVKTTNNFNQPLVNVGLKVLKINPDTFNIIQTFQTIEDCVRQMSKIVSRTGLTNSIKNCTIYRGYRWKLDDNNELKPTKISRVQNVGYIAKLNKEKTQILRVYLDRKSAANDNGCQSDSFLDLYVKNAKPYKGYFYQLYETCSESLKENYTIKDPVLYKDYGVGQFSENNKLIMEFKSKKECCLILNISNKSLTKAMTANLMYNECYYKALPDKLYC
jgi:phage anti-repressor protein